MNAEHLRRSLKALWLDYYRNNRHWLDRVGIWVNCGGIRRPSSSFILGTLAASEPRLTQLLPLVVDLSSNPDRIILALGLNFNPDAELQRLEAIAAPTKMLPDRTQATTQSIATLNHEQNGSKLAHPPQQIKAGTQETASIEPVDALKQPNHPTDPEAGDRTSSISENSGNSANSASSASIRSTATNPNHAAMVGASVPAPRYQRKD